MDFVAEYRGATPSTDALAASSITDLLPTCVYYSCIATPTQERPISWRWASSCVAVGELTCDVTSGICNRILRSLAKHGMRYLESVQGQLLDEVIKSNERLLDLAELNEELLWDDIGIVAGEDSRQSLYNRLGNNSDGERAVSPEIVSRGEHIPIPLETNFVCFSNFFSYIFSHVVEACRAGILLFYKTKPDLSIRVEFYVGKHGRTVSLPFLARE